jgi:hypothetical protein
MKCIFQNEIERSAWDYFPVLKEIPMRSFIEGDSAGFQREDGKVVDLKFQTISAVQDWQCKDARGFDPETFFELANTIGAELGRQMMDGFLNEVREAVAATGNVVDSDGTGLTFEKLLESFTKMQTDFDDAGKPSEKVLVVSPEIHAKLQQDIKHWLLDPKKIAAWKLAEAKHRQSFHEREARRRMVD